MKESDMKTCDENEFKIKKFTLVKIQIENLLIWENSRI